jgi:hypothetical protein
MNFAQKCGVCVKTGSYQGTASAVPNTAWQKDQGFSPCKIRSDRG